MMGHGEYIILRGHYVAYSPPPPPPPLFGSARRCAWLSCTAGQSCTAKQLEVNDVLSGTSSTVIGMQILYSLTNIVTLNSSL